MDHLKFHSETKCKDCDFILAGVADEAVRKTFAILGVDVTLPESVEAFREDLRFGRKLRKISERSALAIVGVIAAGIASSVWYLIGNYFNGSK